MGRVGTWGPVLSSRLLMTSGRLLRAGWKSNQMPKTQLFEELKRAKEWTKVIKDKTDGRAGGTVSEYHMQASGAAHRARVMWLPNLAHFQAVVQEQH